VLQLLLLLLLQLLRLLLPQLLLLLLRRRVARLPAADAVQLGHALQLRPAATAATANTSTVARLLVRWHQLRLLRMPAACRRAPSRHAAGRAVAAAAAAEHA
jgi:hypothetical protein